MLDVPLACSFYRGSRRLVRDSLRMSDLSAIFDLGSPKAHGFREVYLKQIAWYGWVFVQSIISVVPSEYKNESKFMFWFQPVSLKWCLFLEF